MGPARRTPVAFVPVICALLASAAQLGVCPTARAMSSKSWTDLAPAVVSDIERGRPLVVLVVVPLCSNSQIACGRHGLGSPGSLRTNLYWGALYGARRFFDRPERGYERVAVESGDGSTDSPWLERVIYRRWVAAAPWAVAAGASGATPPDEARGGRVEQIVVLEGFHGEHIDAAVDRFWALAVEGGTVRFHDGDGLRTERIHVVGYAGHDRLMDGHRLPELGPSPGARPIPSFVLACLSERFFGAPLRAAGSSTLVTTSAYVAPEGYAIEAAVRALGSAAPPEAVRQEVVTAYAKWQAIPWRQASRYFAP
jgi:hypothetical protein